MKIDLGGKLPHEAAENDPDLMRLWGEINNAWDEIERLLYVAFDSLLIDTHSFATQAVFYSQKSHAARRDMVESLAKYALLNRPQTAKKLKTAIKRVRARANDRNKLTHGTWSIGVDLKSKKVGLQRIALSSDLIPTSENFYPQQRLLKIRNSMRDTAEALRDAINPIDTAKRAKLLELGEKHMQMAILLEK